MKIAPFSDAISRGSFRMALLVTIGIAALSSGTPALAQPTQAAIRTLNIPAQPLANALQAFMPQSGIQLSYPSNLADGRTSAAVNGTLPPAEALSRLLTATGLTYRFVSPTAITLERAPTADVGTVQLGAVRVEGSDGRGTALGGNLRGPNPNPVARRLNPQTTAGSKEPVSPRELPQSVTVITRDQIQQQTMQTLDDAMRYTPGVTVLSNDSERTQFYSRGFQINTWMLDGLPTTRNVTSIAPNLAMFDRVEVLRGPDGLMNGFGSEGGAVNLVRKRAPDTFDLKAEALAGTYNEFGGTLDVGSPLNASGTIRTRVVGNLQSQDLMWDTSYRRDKLVYGTLETDLTPTTLLRIGGSYSHTAERANWNGEPTYLFPVGGKYLLFPLPRSTYLGPDWNRNTYSSTTAFAQLDQDLGAGWSAKLAFNYLGGRDSVLNDTVQFGADNATNLFYDEVYKWHQSDDQESVDAFLSGPVHLFGRTHRLTVGASYQYEHLIQTNFNCGPNDSSSGDAYCDSSDTLAELQNARQPAFDEPVNRDVLPTSQYGLYANARISLADPLTLIAGVRATWWEGKEYDDGVQSFRNRISGKVTPYGGLIFDLDRTYSLYVSYTGIFNPQTARTFQGDIPPPLRGDQYEAGIKGEYFGGRLNTSLSLFQVTEANRALTDPLHPNQGYSVAQGKARSRGIELTATGELTPDWTINAGYTYTDAKYLDQSKNWGGVGFSSIAPKHLFKLWTNYRLPGDLNRFSVGGGIYAQSGIWATDGAGGYLHEGGYATVDLQAAYRISDKLTLSVNATNVLDRHYYATIYSVYQAFYGAPRQVLLTLRYGM